MEGRALTQSLLMARAGSSMGGMRKSAAFSVASSVDSVSHLLRAADMASARSIRTMSNLGRLAEIEGERQLRLDEKAAARQVQEAAFAALQEEEDARRKDKAAAAAAVRQARADEAARVEEEIKAAAQRKIAAADARVAEHKRELAELAKKRAKHAAEVAARRNATYQAGADTLENRTKTFQARQAASDELQRQRDSLRQVEARIKEEEAFLKQEARAAAKARAEAEAEQRKRNYENQQKAKAAQLRAFNRAQEEERMRKSQDASMRMAQNKEKVRVAAETDFYKRELFRSITESKGARSDAIQMERERLAASMQLARHSAQIQESSMRASLELMRNKGSMLSPRASLSMASQFSRHESFDTRRPASASHAAAPGRAALGVSVDASSMQPKASYKARPASAMPGSGYGSSPQATRSPAAAATHAPMEPARSTFGIAAPSMLERCEADLRRSLRDEIDRESERQAILAGTSDPAENARISVIFGKEREEAKQRILALSASVHAAAVVVQHASPAAPAPAATLAGGAQYAAKDKALTTHSPLSSPSKQAWTIPATPVA